MTVVRLKDRKASRHHTVRKLAPKLERKKVAVEAEQAAEKPKPYTPPADPSYVHPSHLHGVLAPAQVKVMTFHSEKAIANYRQVLYNINKEGQFRYRTMRDEKSMWGLIIWRMK